MCLWYAVWFVAPDVDAVLVDDCATVYPPFSQMRRQPDLRASIMGSAPQPGGAPRMSMLPLPSEAEISQFEETVANTIKTTRLKFTTAMQGGVWRW